MSGSLAIVLAAGKGTRMNADRPKVLCEALGRPLVEYVLDALDRAEVDRVLVVVGFESDQVREALAERSNLEFVEQTEQLGTGHAVMVCRDQLSGYDGPVLVLAGDSPLFQTSSIKQLFAAYDQGRPACVMGTLHKEDPTGLGRVVRDEQGDFVGIVEEKDATDEQRRITEVNMSIYVFDCRELLHALEHLKSDNRQKEYYLTDCPGMLKSEGKDVRALPVLEPCEALAVNTKEELRIVEAEMQRLGY
jgi:bifunctional UDP-N-acetylglucosamine pyrophosphorylase/glucosamine-1-phosphate N-acetyltransferase/UDP-N-acetylglucosamine pyrophosphorylase